MKDYYSIENNIAVSHIAVKNWKSKPDNVIELTDEKNHLGETWDATNKVFIAPPVIIKKPTWTRKEFLDHLGDDTIAEFLLQLDAGDMDARVFDYRLLRSGDVIDTSEESVVKGIAWLEGNVNIPSFTDTKRKKIKGE